MNKRIGLCLLHVFAVYMTLCVYVSAQEGEYKEGRYEESKYKENKYENIDEIIVSATGIPTQREQIGTSVAVINALFGLGYP